VDRAAADHPNEIRRRASGVRRDPYQLWFSAGRHSGGADIMTPEELNAAR
jgi:hypothetical protein